MGVEVAGLGFRVRDLKQKEGNQGLRGLRGLGFRLLRGFGLWV